MPIPEIEMEYDTLVKWMDDQDEKENSSLGEVDEAIDKAAMNAIRLMDYAMQVQSTATSLHESILELKQIVEQEQEQSFGMSSLTPSSISSNTGTTEGAASTTHETSTTHESESGVSQT
jgi:hypothetical protein